MDMILDALTEMRTDIGIIKQDVAGLKQEVKSLDGRLSRVEEKVDALGVTVKENTEMIKALTNRTDMLDAKMDGLTLGTASTAQVQAVRREFREHLRNIGQAFMIEA